MIDGMKVEMYTTTWCPWCTRAKRLFASRGVDNIEEIDVTEDQSAMVERAGGRMSVPQIFIDGVHVGGHDELVQWIRDGRLERAVETGS